MFKIFLDFTQLEVISNGIKLNEAIKYKIGSTSIALSL